MNVPRAGRPVPPGRVHHVLTKERGDSITARTNFEGTASGSRSRSPGKSEIDLRSMTGQFWDTFGGFRNHITVG